MEPWTLENLPANEQAAEVDRIYTEEASRMCTVEPTDMGELLRELVEQVIIANREYARRAAFPLPIPPTRVIILGPPDNPDSGHMHHIDTADGIKPRHG